MFRGRKRIPYDPPGQRKSKGKRREWMRSDQIFLNRRVFLMKGAIVAGFATLAARLGYMQIVKGDYYQKETADTTQRWIPETPVRGLIFDRQGRLRRRWVQNLRGVVPELSSTGWSWRGYGGRARFPTPP